MGEILHQLTCMKPCRWWDILLINWCRISAINSRTISSPTYGQFDGYPRRIHRFMGTGDVSPKVPRVFVRIVNSTREISAMASTPNSVHSTRVFRVKREFVSFFGVWSFIDGCFFIFVLSSVRHFIWTASTDTWQDQSVAPSKAKPFVFANLWSSIFLRLRTLLSWREPNSRRHCCLQWQRHSHPSDEFCYPSKVDLV